MMNLVVDPVEQQPVDHALVLAEGLVDVFEPRRRDAWPQRVDARGGRIPSLQERRAGVGAGTWHVMLQAALDVPVTGGDTLDARAGHRNQLEGHRAEGPHAAEREVEQRVFRKRLDHPSRESAMTLPVLVQEPGLDADGGRCRGHGNLQ